MSSSNQSWGEWATSWGAWALDKAVPGVGTAVKMASSLLSQAQDKSKEENDTTDYSEIDSEIEQFAKAYNDFHGGQQDLGRMLELQKTAERHIETAKVALANLPMKTQTSGLEERRKILSTLEKQAREMKSKMNDVLRDCFRQMSQKLNSETSEATQEISKLKRLETKPAQFVREYESIMTTLNRVEESHQDAHKWLKTFPIENGLSTMQELEFAEKRIKQARSSAEDLRDAVFEKLINKITKGLENVEKYASKIEKMEPNSRKSQSESACQKLNDALKEVEKSYQEAKNAFGGSEKDAELKSKEEEIEEAAERVEQVESLSQQVISCVEETAEITKHLEDAEKSARAAQHMAPKMRKTREFADECGNMSDAIKAAKASYQKAQDNLEELPSDVMGRGSMERKLKSKEEEIEKAQKQQGYLESLRNQPVSCVCVVM